MNPDLDVIFGEVFESSFRKCVSIRHPECVRRILLDTDEFCKREVSWQLRILRRVCQALRSKYDVVRFLILERTKQGEITCGNSSLQG